MKRFLSLMVCLCLPIGAQQLDLPATADPAQLAEALPGLARQALAAYQEKDADRRLATLARLRLAAGQPAEALQAIEGLRQARLAKDPRRGGVALMAEALMAQAQQRQAQGAPFDEAFKAAFRETFHGLDDRAAVEAANGLRFDAGAERRDLLGVLAARKGRSGASLTEALDLVQKSEADTFAQRALPLMGDLMAEDDRGRFTIDTVLVPTPDGVSVQATIARPKGASAPLPSAFEFTVYAGPFNLIEAKRSAAHGFAGVVANTRGKGLGPGEPVPYEHDGGDADAVIDWIAKQAWSDGKVGMYGGSYDGFTQWAAAKHRPAALKSLMPSVAVAPGLDTPMEGGVFENFTYKWIPYVTTTKGLDEEGYNDWGHWNGLDWSWFTSGKPYRDLDVIDGKPNPLFRRWLDHPTYDAYWKAMVPVGEEFAGIDIPVLATTGYYDGCQLGSLHYFQELMKHAPQGERYLVIGPYDHIGAQRYARDVVGDYRIDPAARIDIEALRYQWLDHTLRGGPRPALLADRVNYEVMGADTWKHAPSIPAMANGSLKLYLNPVKAGDLHLLDPKAPGKGELRLRVDLEDRNILKFNQPLSNLAKDLAADDAFTFATAPLKAALEIGGLPSGRLDFTTNKKDFDFCLELYELTPQGDYLFLTYVLSRASHVKDPSRRHLLRPGQPESLPLRGGRMISRRVEAGSRIVAVLGINKQPRMQFNHGTGKDVSSESMADAKVPLDVAWRGTSFIQLPTWK